jgi:hypothetical protein
VSGLGWETRIAKLWRDLRRSGKLVGDNSEVWHDDIGGRDYADDGSGHSVSAHVESSSRNTRWENANLEPSVGYYFRDHSWIIGQGSEERGNGDKVERVGYRRR